METQLIDISRILPNTGQIEGLPANPRIIKEERFKKLLKSIQDDPEMLELRELIVYPHQGSYVVIAGNMRLKAINELNYKSAPCKILQQDTPIEKLKAYTIKDNVPFGENDWDLLANEWDTDQLTEWGLKLFDPSEDADEFFHQPKEGHGRIVLEYPDETLAKVNEEFEKREGSKENVLLGLLGL